jgi:hypothetical protein
VRLISSRLGVPEEEFTFVTHQDPHSGNYRFGIHYYGQHISRTVEFTSVLRFGPNFVDLCMHTVQEMSEALKAQWIELGKRVCQEIVNNNA